MGRRLAFILTEYCERCPEHAEKQLRAAIKENWGRTDMTAKALGISTTHLYRLMEELGIADALPRGAARAPSRPKAKGGTVFRLRFAHK